MKPLLARENLELLAQFASSRMLLALDYDGTLAPIVDDRHEAYMRAATSRLLRRASELYPCAVISGRAQRDLSRRLMSARVKYVLGNRGIDIKARPDAFARQVAVTCGRLESSLEGLAGVEIEDKTFSIAIHYRRSRRKRDARAAIVCAVERLPERMRVIPGKNVINLVSADAPNKGDALVDARARAGADTALYVGDDVSDEDVFSLDQPGRLLGIRVGRSQRSAAPYYLRDQGEVDALLSTLIELRQQLASRRSHARVHLLGGR